MMRAIGRVLRQIMGMALLGFSSVSLAAADAIKIEVRSPTETQVVQNRVHLAPVQGSATAESRPIHAYDLLVALDASYSTNVASGADVDGDGVVGVNPQTDFEIRAQYPEEVLSTDAGDSIFAAQIKAVRLLLKSLDFQTVRVGVLTFAGDMDVDGYRRHPDQKDAKLWVPLTNDFPQVLTRLAEIEAQGPDEFGATNFAAGIQLGVTELAGLRGAQSTPRSDAKRIMLFLTDGKPTFPVGSGGVSDPGDSQAAVAAAQVARAAGITIHTYALGPIALTKPLALTEIARITLGAFLPLQKPADIVAALQTVSFASVDDVVFKNLTTGDFSTDVDLKPDGKFSGFVPAREGVNRVRVTALSTNGTQKSVEFDLTFAISSLSEGELAAELERIRRRNREIELLAERKRIEEFRRKEQQRKELEITIENKP